MKFNKIKNFLKVNKEGSFAGIGVAFLLYYANFNLPINLHAEGITKLIIMILIFGGIGMGLDAIIEPSK